MDQRRLGAHIAAVFSELFLRFSVCLAEDQSRAEENLDIVGRAALGLAPRLNVADNAPDVVLLLAIDEDAFGMGGRELPTARRRSSFYRGPSWWMTRTFEGSAKTCAGSTLTASSSQEPSHSL
jgi:hypothetical protein